MQEQVLRFITTGRAVGLAAYLGVHVGAVHVDLAAVVVNDAADLVHALLVHAVRRRVCDHQRRQPASDMSGALPEVSADRTKELVLGCKVLLAMKAGSPLPTCRLLRRQRQTCCAGG